MAKSRSDSSSGDSSLRKRKAHKKSRLGCRNCKLRRVKCDEKRPMCEKCLEFGVTCNYDPNIPDLQPRPGAAKVICMDTTIHKSPLSSANKPKLDMINISLREDRTVPVGKYGPMRFDFSDLDRLEKFHTRTILTIGTKNSSRILRRELAQLSCSHRFLMHLVQSVTASHDRFLSGSAISKPTPVEMYHMSQGISMFHTKLSRPVVDEDRDALFVAASLLGIITFFTLEAESIEDVWPLKDDDLSWLHLSDGKKAVWHVTDPLRKDSIWRPVADAYAQKLWPTPMIRQPSSPSVFDHLLSDDDSISLAAVNPYHNTVKNFIPLLDMECDDTTWVRFLDFICHTDPPFKVLLLRKDPWAMLMLAYWYMKMCRGPWWVTPRAIFQGKAICMYIERYHADDSALQGAVITPKRELEAALKEGWAGF
ncbi:uncharacterized protein Z518_04854 [Rhinocladiella mackenziei CBS 650.93]|uniref:Zn(2)-C6 fungal-type domain-containing protein n=1 Tax=Rhinocladiella mackenziei CBS 650.93 TaxID=1442369 RepID=A0A0D2H8T3_9EURO|nr:uncharacterized protein Z518_04854 [Rhinocladiella mackenziei CBS 650.93]KIX06878.1 hypothetical protein Z518_04854 [Rhinocladiella mackenziei CBS 650.93]